MFVRFVRAPSFLSKEVVLLKHPDDAAVVSIIGGSSQVEVIFSKKNNVQVASGVVSEGDGEHESPKTATFKGLSLGTTQAHLKDNCLSAIGSSGSEVSKDSGAPPQLTVRVVSLERIEVNYTAKVMMGSWSLIEITLYDNLAQLISQDKFHLINFNCQLSTDAFVSIEKSNSRWPDTNNKRYMLLRPIDVGTTTISVMASLTKPTMSGVGQRAAPSPHTVSTTVVIETYDPLRVSPSEIYAIPHMTFQLSLKGGPSVSAEHRIEYHYEAVTSKEIEKVIEVNDKTHTIFTKSPGQVLITLKSVSVSTGVVLSEAVVRVRCAPLQSVEIGAPSQVVLLNNTVTATARLYNLNGHTVTFGVLPPTLIYVWRLGTSNEIVSSYWLSGFEGSDDGSQSINVQFKELGRFSLQLRVYVNNDYLPYVDKVHSTLFRHRAASNHDPLSPKPIQADYYLFAKRDFETIPRLSIEPPKSIQLGAFNWKHHDASLINALPVMSDYVTSEFNIPVDGFIYILNADHHNQWSNSVLYGGSGNGAKIDMGVHWLIVSSSPKTVVELSCFPSNDDDHNELMTSPISSANKRISRSGQRIQCPNQYLAIKSTSHLGSVVILASQRLQSRTLTVNVKTIAQLSLVLVSPIKPSKTIVNPQRLFAFPVGYSAHFKLIAIDILGEPFSTVVFKNVRLECVNCKNVILKNMFEEDGSLYVTMKHPGSVAIKVSLIEGPPSVHYTLHFIVVHGLTALNLAPSQQETATNEYGSSDNRLENRDVNLSETGRYEYVPNHSVTVIEEVVIRRCVGMVYVVSPLFSSQNDHLDWEFSTNQFVQLVWLNNTHAAFYSTKVGETKLAAVSFLSKQTVGHAVISTTIPEAIVFDGSPPHSNKQSTWPITNAPKFERCYPIRVVGDGDTVINPLPFYPVNSLTDAPIYHPFECVLSDPNYESHYDRDSAKDNNNDYDEFYGNFFDRNFKTHVKLDLGRMTPSCCVRFVGIPRTLTERNAIVGKEKHDYVSYSPPPPSTGVLRVYLKDHPKLVAEKTIGFVEAFQLSGSIITDTTSGIDYVIADESTHHFDPEIPLPVYVPRDGSVASILLTSDVNHLPHITVSTSHPDCFAAKLIQDQHSSLNNGRQNGSMIVRVRLLSSDCYAYANDNVVLEAKSKLTGQTIRRTIVCSQDSSPRMRNKRSLVEVLFYLLRVLPKTFSFELRTGIFAFVSCAGTLMLLYVFSDRQRRNYIIAGMSFMQSDGAPNPQHGGSASAPMAGYYSVGSESLRSSSKQSMRSARLPPLSSATHSKDFVYDDDDEKIRYRRK